MSRCDRVRSHLTALADDEVRGWQKWRLQRHLRRCSSCPKDLLATKRSIEQQSAVLKNLLETTSVDVDSLRRRARLEIAREAVQAPSPFPQWRHSLRPLLAGCAALGLIVLSLSWTVGGPEDVLITLGVVEPPKSLARKTELFYDYTLIEKLDALENFDSVNSVPLEGEQTSFHPVSWAG